MKDSPLVRTSTGTSFEASSAMSDAINLYIMDVTFSAITATEFCKKKFKSLCVIFSDEGFTIGSYKYRY